MYKSIQQILYFYDTIKQKSFNMGYPANLLRVRSFQYRYVCLVYCISTVNMTAFLLYRNVSRHLQACTHTCLSLYFCSHVYLYWFPCTHKKTRFSLHFYTLSVSLLLRAYLSLLLCGNAFFVSISMHTHTSVSLILCIHTHTSVSLIPCIQLSESTTHNVMAYLMSFHWLYNKGHHSMNAELCGHDCKWLELCRLSANKCLILFIYYIQNYSIPTSI